MPDDVTTSTSATAPDTSTPSTPASPDTSTAAPQTPSATSAPQPNPGTGAPAPSDPNSVVQQPQPGQPAQKPIDFEARYRELQSYADKRWQQAQQRIQSYEQQLSQFRAQQEQAAKAKAAMPWQKESPDRAKFQSVLERSKAIERQVQAAQSIQDPVQREAAMNAIASGISEEEQAQLRQFREQQREFQANFFSDPEGALAPVMEKVAQSVFSRMRDELQGRMRVEQDFEAPHLQPILQNPRHAGYLQEKLAAGVDYDTAMELVKYRAAAEMMHQRLTGMEPQVAAAQEQQRLAKARASGVIAPDPATAPVDPYALAMKDAKTKGIMPGTPAFNQLLLKYSN